MKVIYSCLWMIWLTALLATLAVAGQESSGGGDTPLHPEASRIWFPKGALKPILSGGSPNISYCIEVDQAFGVSVAEAQRAILFAFQTWDNYIGEKVDPSRFDLPHWSSRLKFFSQCSSDIDIRFYFGVNKPEVTSALKRYNNPIAMAEAISTTGEIHFTRTKGFIWLRNPGSQSNFWQRTHNLQTVLIHEIGHVWGCGHVEGTVMMEDMNSLLRSINSWDGFRNKIDLNKELFRDFRNAKFRTKLSVANWDLGVVKNLTGHDRSEVAEIFLEMGGYSGDGKLVFQGKDGWEISFYLAFTLDSETNIGAGLFYIGALGPDSAANVYTKAKVFSGVIINGDSRIPVVLTYNVDSKLKLSVFLPTGWNKIFGGDLETIQ